VPRARQARTFSDLEGEVPGPKTAQPPTAAHVTQRARRVPVRRHVRPRRGRGGCCGSASHDALTDRCEMFDGGGPAPR